MTDPRCVIVGGGPAGMMLGLLLARAGVSVTVLEKHADFFRDFRGDTIHPSTLEILDELGMLDEFLALPHQEVRFLTGQVGDTKLELADFTHLPVRTKFIAFMPQWDFLNFVAGKAKVYPTFHLEMQSEARGLVFDGERVSGVKVKTQSGSREILADLVVGADGRDSSVRDAAGLESIDFGAPMDALWMRISRKPGDPAQLLGRLDYGKIFVLIDRGDYWQAALVVRKGAYGEIQKRGLPAFRADIAEIAPFLKDRLNELRDWNDIKLLVVQVDRLRRWYREGLLCIGDAAHAMSPVAGVGINLAIQDAVAAANILAPILRGAGRVPVSALARVQERREFPTRVIQRVQLIIQNSIIGRILGTPGRMSAPLLLRMFAAVPWFRRLPARLVGLGVRREHVSI